MKLFQKIIFIGGLIVASIYFIYTLSFSSGWALGEPLGEFYTEAQVVNKLIFKWALWTLILAGLNIIFHTHKNRNFYFMNYILILLFSASLIGSGIVTMDKVPPLESSYLATNQAFLTLITAINYSKISTRIFDYGTYVSILMFVQAGVIIIFTIFKTILQIKRAKIKKLRRMGNAHGNI